MTDSELVHVGPKDSDTAILLLAAVEELGLDPSVVRTDDNGFLAPAEVVEKAGLDKTEADDKAAADGKDEGAAEGEEPETEPEPAPKTTKKSPKGKE